jgi:hypothetical protein
MSAEVSRVIVSLAWLVLSEARRNVLNVERWWGELRRTHFVEAMASHFVRGVPIRELMGRIGLPRNTVRAALRPGEPPAFRCPERRSNLEPFRDEIHRLLKEDPKLPGVRVPEETEPLGFDGGRTIVDDQLREVRPYVREAPHASADDVSAE